MYKGNSERWIEQTTLDRYASKKMEAKEGNRGISPVIATVILVAVAITLSVAVAYWMGGLTSSYTRFEKLDLISTRIEEGLIVVTARNTGPSDIVVTDVFIGEKVVSTPNQKISIGTTVEVSFPVPTGIPSGTTIAVRLHTAAGSDYTKLVVIS